MEGHTEGCQYWVSRGGWALAKGAESILGRGTVWGKPREAGPGLVVLEHSETAGQRKEQRADWGCDEGLGAV